MVLVDMPSFIVRADIFTAIAARDEMSATN